MNLSRRTKTAQSIVGYSAGRPDDDFYPTPPEATWALLNNHKFGSENVWECACGDGAISRVLETGGYKAYSSDLYYRGYGVGGADFLKTTKLEAPVIITNPPFKLAEKFMLHAISLGVWELALLCKLSFLEGYRRSALLMEYPPARVLVFRKRLTMTRRGEPMRNGGMIAFAWFVWIYPHDTKPTIDWI